MMVLVDTSLWAEHLRRRNSILARLLEDGRVLTHPAVVGELACADLQHRDEILEHLGALPTATVASDHEVHQLVDLHGLDGLGLGWLDAHLLASARLDGCRLWTRDRVLRHAARWLGVG
jgi:predicted nucleic acid-binding protein